MIFNNQSFSQSYHFKILNIKNIKFYYIIKVVFVKIRKHVFSPHPQSLLVTLFRMSPQGPAHLTSDWLLSHSPGLSLADSPVSQRLACDWLSGLKVKSYFWLRGAARLTQRELLVSGPGVRLLACGGLFAWSGLLPPPVLMAPSSFRSRQWAGVFITGCSSEKD